MRMSWRWRMAGALSAVVVAACSGGEGDDDDGTDTPSPTPTTAPDQAIELRFEARFGDDPFACGGDFSPLGSSGTTFTPSDLRFYVHDVRLVTAGGAEVAVELEQDGVWQYERLALIDFEDKTSACSNGTTLTNDRVVGTVPAGDYTGVTFVLGVPFELNHQDVTAASSPLNLTSMFWSWNAGYKFFRVDGATTGQPTGLFIHLGSTGCEMDGEGVVTGCAQANRAEVTLSGFDPDQDVIVADLAALFDGMDLDSNTADTAPGCMSQTEDPDCVPVFSNLGLPFGEEPADPESQTLFHVE